MTSACYGTLDGGAEQMRVATCWCPDPRWFGALDSVLRVMLPVVALGLGYYNGAGGRMRWPRGRPAPAIESSDD